MWWHHLTHLKFTHTSKSVWNISYFRQFCIGLGPEDIITNSLNSEKKLYQQHSYKFLISTHNLGFRILGFYHRDQWRGAGVLAGKECWGPCHGLIASLWDFAQNYSQQIELRNQNWRGTFHSRIRLRQGNGAVHFEGGEGPACWVQCANMCQDGILTGVQRNTAFVEQSWFMMAWTQHVWINAMVFVPMPETPPKAGAKDLLSSLNLIHEFTSLFSPKVIFAGLPGKAFPRKHAFVDISVFLWLRKQRPRFAQGQPKGYSQLKELHRTTQAIAQMNADWKVEKGHYAEFNVPTCCKIAVWLLRRETQPLWNSHDSWWPELKMFGSMPWCSFPWHKLLPSLAQKTCFTVSLNLIHELTSLFGRR